MSNFPFSSKTALFLFFGFVFVSCSTKNRPTEMAGIKLSASTEQTIFWAELEKICGQAFEGTITAGPANDTTGRRTNNNELIEMGKELSIFTAHITRTEA